jgi:hypothetical protein
VLQSISYLCSRVPLPLLKSISYWCCKVQVLPVLFVLYNFSFLSVNGEWVSAQSQQTIAVTNPLNGKVPVPVYRRYRYCYYCKERHMLNFLCTQELCSVPDMGVEDTERAVDAAYTAFQVPLLASCNVSEISSK